MTDILAKYPVKEVHAWYTRLVAYTNRNKVVGHSPLSAQFLDAYLKNKNPKAKLTFVAPPYLKSAVEVQAGLLYQRKVFLTEEKAKIRKANWLGTVPRKWAGIIPRLQKGIWSGNGNLIMSYESLVAFGSNSVKLYAIQKSGTPAQRDLVASLRGFQLHSDVTVIGKRTGDIVDVTFKRWMIQANDRYDWNYNEHLTMPNPDFGSKSSNAIEPKLKSIRVFHKNAQRMEKAKLAAPYDLVVGPWKAQTNNVIKSAKVDANKKLS